MVFFLPTPTGSLKADVFAVNTRTFLLSALLTADCILSTYSLAEGITEC